MVSASNETNIATPVLKHRIAARILFAMEPTFFTTQGHFRKWLEKNHEKASELLVGFWKVGSGKPSMTWSESVDQALCFGWIDGVRRSLGADAYTIRFTRRRPKSIWSRINIDKAERLRKDGLMHPAGAAAYERKEDHRAVIYSYENRPKEFAPECERKFRKYRKAWKFFEDQPPSYKRMTIYWVMSAKQEATRASRLEKLIAASADAQRI